MTEKDKKVLEHYNELQKSITLNLNAVKSITPEMITLIELHKGRYTSEINEIIQKTIDTLSDMADQNMNLTRLSKGIVEDYLKNSRYDNN